jgi:hypothetical protein
MLQEFATKPQETIGTLYGQGVVLGAVGKALPKVKLSEDYQFIERNVKTDKTGVVVRDAEGNAIKTGIKQFNIPGINDIESISILGPLKVVGGKISTNKMKISEGEVVTTKDGSPITNPVRYMTLGLEFGKYGGVPILSRISTETITRGGETVGVIRNTQGNIITSGKTETLVSGPKLMGQYLPGYDYYLGTESITSRVKPSDVSKNTNQPVTGLGASVTDRIIGYSEKELQRLQLKDIAARELGYSSLGGYEKGLKVEQFIIDVPGIKNVKETSRLVEDFSIKHGGRFYGTQTERGLPEVFRTKSPGDADLHVSKNTNNLPKDIEKLASDLRKQGENVQVRQGDPSTIEFIDTGKNFMEIKSTKFKQSDISPEGARGFMYTDLVSGQKVKMGRTESYTQGEHFLRKVGASEVISPGGKIIKIIEPIKQKKSTSINEITKEEIKTNKNTGIEDTGKPFVSKFNQMWENLGQKESGLESLPLKQVRIIGKPGERQLFKEESVKDVEGTKFIKEASPLEQKGFNLEKDIKKREELKKQQKSSVRKTTNEKYIIREKIGETKSFSEPGILGKQGEKQRGLKDTAGQFRIGLGIARIKSQSWNPLERARAVKGREALKRDLATYTKEQQKDIRAKMVEQMKYPEKKYFNINYSARAQLKNLPESLKNIKASELVSKGVEKVKETSPYIKSKSNPFLSPVSVKSPDSKGAVSPFITKSPTDSPKTSPVSSPYIRSPMSSPYIRSPMSSPINNMSPRSSPNLSPKSPPPPPLEEQFKGFGMYTRRQPQTNIKNTESKNTKTQTFTNYLADITGIGKKPSAQHQKAQSIIEKGFGSVKTGQSFRDKFGSSRF